VLIRRKHEGESFCERAESLSCGVVPE